MSLLAFHIVQMTACHTMQKPFCIFFPRTDPNQQSRKMNSQPSHDLTPDIKGHPTMQKKMRCCFHYSFAPYILSKPKDPKYFKPQGYFLLEFGPTKASMKRHDSRWCRTRPKAPIPPPLYSTQNFLKLEFLSMHVD